MFNARSMNYANTVDLMIKQKRWQADVIAIVETWENCRPLIGYQLITKSTTNRPYGGLAIYARLEYTVIQTQRDQDDNILQAKVVATKNEHLHILISYFPPQMNRTQWNKQYEEYKHSLQVLSNVYSSPQVVAYADFNEDIGARKIEGYYTLNFQGTREHAGILSNIDFVHVSKSMRYAAALEERVGRSDHYTIRLRIPNILPMKRKKFRAVNRARLVNIAEELLESSRTPGEFLRRFDERVETEKSDIIRMCKYPKMTLYQQGALEILKKAQTVNEYREETAELWELITESTIHDRIICPKRFWKLITTRKGYKKSACVVNTITTAEGEAQGEELLDELARQVSQYHLASEQPPVLLSLPHFETLTTHEELLSYGKALGPDLIPDDIIRIMVEAEHKLDWLNDPETYSHLAARICLLNKTEDRAPSLSNTRPIAIQSVIFKIAESALIPKICLINNQDTSIMQFGFKMGKSTHLPQQLLFSRVIEDSLNKDCKTSFTIFVDLKKAYDSVFRRIILSEMKDKLTVEEFRLLTLLYTYNKFQIGNNDIHPNRGLMQGSVLSPHIFNVIIDSLVRKINEKMFAPTFADDIAAHGNEPKNLQQIWKEIKVWGEKTGVEPNPTKCAVLIHKAKGKKREMIVKFAEEHGIPIVTQYKYLGTILTKNATAASLIKDISRRSIQRAIALSKLGITRHSVRAASIVYQATVLPLLTYALPMAYVIRGYKGTKAVQNVMDAHYRAAKQIMRLPKNLSRATVDILIPEPETLTKIQFLKIQAKLQQMFLVDDGSFEQRIQDKIEEREEIKKLTRQVTENMTPTMLSILKINRTYTRQCKRCQITQPIRHCADHQLNLGIRVHLKELLDPNKSPYDIFLYLHKLDSEVIEATYAYVLVFL